MSNQSHLHIFDVDDDTVTLIQSRILPQDDLSEVVFLQSPSSFEEVIAMIVQVFSQPRQVIVVEGFINHLNLTEEQIVAIECLLSPFKEVNYYIKEQPLVLRRYARYMKFENQFKRGELLLQIISDINEIKYWEMVNL